MLLSRTIMRFSGRKVTNSQVIQRRKQKYPPSIQPSNHRKDLPYQIMKKINLNDFDMFQGIRDIQIEGQNSREWNDRIREMYARDDRECWQVARLRQEDMINNLESGWHMQDNLNNILQLKVGLAFKFRRYQQLIVDLQNQLQILKQRVDRPSKQQQQAQYITLYNQLTSAYILSDHDRLRRLLTTKPKQKTPSGRRQKQDQIQPGLLFYLGVVESATAVQMGQKMFQGYYKSLVLQIVGLLAVGQSEEAMRRLSTLTLSNYPEHLRCKAFTILLTVMSYQGQSKKHIPKPQLLRLEMMSTLSAKKMYQLSAYGLGAEQCQTVLKTIIGKAYNKTMEKLDAYLGQYSRLLFLLAENYYLQGREADSQRIRNLISRAKSPQAQLMATYLTICKQFDNSNYQTALQLFQSFQQQQQQLLTSPSQFNRQFYNPRLVHLDPLRLNLHKLIAKVYQQQGDMQKAKEQQDEAVALEIALNVYSLKEPTLDKEDVNENWRNKSAIRVPSYYFGVGVGEVFEMNWHADYGIK